MDSFDDKIAVITGGGTGMGRELARQLAAAGCHVAMCDVSKENMARTKALCEEECEEQATVRITTHLADVSDEKQVLAFRDEVMQEQVTDCVHLVFNNAGIGGAGSLINDDRESWEKTFDVCWYGVYYGTRAFLPLLLAAEEGHLINTSSVNGFWASLGPETPHTAYSAAKFAVKGFTEALLTGLRVNAPHVKAAVVMPGHVGTSIAINSRLVHGKGGVEDMTAEELAETRKRMARQGMPTEGASDEQLRAAIKQRGEQFRDNAPVSAAQAAKIILDGVRNEEWRILVGEDAKALDERVRANPLDAYDLSFVRR